MQAVNVDVLAFLLIILCDTKLSLSLVEMDLNIGDTVDAWSPSVYI